MEVYWIMLHPCSGQLERRQPARWLIGVSSIRILTSQKFRWKGKIQRAAVRDDDDDEEDDGDDEEEDEDDEEEDDDDEEK